MPGIFTTHPAFRFGIIFLFSLAFMGAHLLFSHVMKHTHLTGVGPEFPTLHTILRILMYLMFTVNSFLFALVWLWWFYDTASRIRGALFSIGSWFVFTAVFIQILESILSIIKTFTFTNITHTLQREMVFNAKIALIAFAVFFVMSTISGYLKGRDVKAVISH